MHARSWDVNGVQFRATNSPTVLDDSPSISDRMGIRAERPKYGMMEIVSGAARSTCFANAKRMHKMKNT